MMPSLGAIIGAICHETQRGAAMGMLSSGMTLGSTVAPFLSGLLFESSYLLTDDYQFNQLNGAFARKPRDPTCTAAIAATTSCTPPDYEPEFQTVFSLTPYVLASIFSALGALVMVTFVPDARLSVRSRKAVTGKPLPEEGKGARKEQAAP